MIRAIVLGLAVLLGLGASARAQVITALLEPARPALKSEATVVGDIVRVGDLVANAGIISDVAIFRAPDLGSCGRVSATRVLEAVRTHALVGLNPGSITEITVTRASRAIAVKDVELRVAQALAGKFELGDARDVALNLDRPLRTVYVEPTARGAMQVDRLSYDPRNGRFDVTVEIPGTPLSPIRLTGAAAITSKVVIITRALARGEVIKAADVSLERRPRAEIGGDAVTDPNRAIGQAARAVLGAGRVLHVGELKKPEVVQRNDNIMLTYEIPGIMLTVRGKASESGAEGDTIEVLNAQSKRPVQGVVTGPGRVRVSSLTPRVVANSEPADPPPSKAPAGAQ